MTIAKRISKTLAAAALIKKGSQTDAAMGFDSQHSVCSLAVGFCDGEKYLEDLEEKFCRVVDNLECLEAQESEGTNVWRGM